ncbi:MAG TPA: tetratricopeptide repeat protein [Gammaproteobacteria bacterium]|nr:tetratricopeptide repeat protein [Gammaproteobacteria bacterium]
MSHFKHKFTSLCIAVALGTAASFSDAGESENINQLLNQGHYWYEQGRPDFTEEAWRKVLLVDPGNTEALAGLREIEKTNLDQLDRDTLKHARSLAQQKDYPQAIELYRAAFKAYGGQPPTAYLAAEYYQTLAATEQGWPTAHAKMSQLVRTYPSNKKFRLALAIIKSQNESTRVDAIKSLQKLRRDADVGSEATRAWKDALLWLGGTGGDWKLAHAGLQQLVNENPGNKEYQFALARLKTYRKHARAEGIRMLQTLSASPALASQANKAWRDALLWMSPKKSDLPLYRDWLVQHPDDDEIRAKMKQRGQAKATVSNSPIVRGYHLLETDHPDQAEREFQRILDRSPNNASALAGLGTIEMRKENFHGALRLFRQAIQSSPRRRNELQDQINESEFWAAFLDAKWARKHGKLEEARRFIEQAEALKPDHFDTWLLHAQIEDQLGDKNLARQYYRKVLDVDPGNTAARDGVIAMLIGMDNHEEAEELITKFGLPDTEYRRIYNQSEADRLHAEGRRNPDPKQATRLLSKAMNLQPDDAWVRLDLARLYRAQGLKEEAVGLFDELIGDNPGNTDAYHAKALFFADNNEPYEALLTLEGIPKEQRTAAQSALYRELYRHIWVRQQRLEAEELIKIKDFNSVRDIAKGIQVVEHYDPEFMLTRAELLADLGETRQAMQLAEKAYALGNNKETGFQIHYATVLLKTRQHTALRALLANLQQTRKLSFRQQDDVDRLRLGLSLQTAEELKSQGRYAEARQALSPIMEKYGEQTDVKLALAALYPGDHKKALKLYREIISDDPTNKAAYAGAAGSYMAQRQFSQAEEVVNKGLERTLDAPQLLALRGGLKIMKGARNSGAQDLHQALTSSGDDSLPGESWRTEARQKLRRLNNEKIDTRLAAGSLRSRRGDNGLDRFAEASIPLEIRHHRDYETSTGLQLQGVAIDAGDMHGDTIDISRLGSAGINPGGFNSEIYNVEDSGVAIAGFYRKRHFTALVGTSPVGFAVNNILGGLHWRFKSYGREFSGDLSRTSVKDSVLSYAGTKDPQTGKNWGGVTRSGLTLNYDQGPGSWGFYGKAGYYKLKGDGVFDNQEAQVKGGLYWKLVDNDDQSLKIGISGHWHSFENNLSYFTLGHGGYFSPQQYVSVTLPIDYESSFGNIHYRFGVDLGIQDFHNDGALAFPDDPALQAQLEVIQQTTVPGLTTAYPEEDINEFAYNIRGEVEYNFSRKLSGGGWFNAGNSENFQELKGGIYLRFYQLPRTEQHPLFLDGEGDPKIERW